MARNIVPLEHPECRICYNSSTPADPLVIPCLCRGSIKWIHTTCLRRWRACIGQPYNCNTCKSRLIKPQAPETPECRVCYYPSTSTNPLIRSCSCKGSDAWMHATCCQELRASTTWPHQCNTCNTLFATTQMRRIMETCIHRAVVILAYISMMIVVCCVQVALNTLSSYLRELTEELHGR